MTDDKDKSKKKKLLYRRDAAEYLSVSIAWLEREAWKGTGPKLIKVGVRAVRYSIEDLDEYIESRTIEPKEDNYARSGSV